MTGEPRALEAFERWVVPEPIRHEPSTGRSTAVVTAGLLGGVLLSLLRHGVGVWDTMWAEDGAVFLTQALSEPVSETLLEPYTGYVHVVPRVVAEVVTWFDLSHAATLFALTGAGLATLGAAATYVGISGHLRSRGLRLALATVVLLAPTAGGETANNISYAHWYLAVGALSLCVWRPRSLVGGAAAGAYLLAVGLTTPLLLVAVPILLVRAVRSWLRRDGAEAVLVGAAVIGIGSQLVALVQAPPTAPVHAGPGSLVEAFLLRVVGGVVPGTRLTGELWNWLGSTVLVLLGMVALGIAGAALIRSSTHVRVLALGWLVLSVTLLLAVDVSRGAIGALVWPPGASDLLNGRYVLIPVALLTAVLLVRADEARDRLSRRDEVRLIAATAAVLAFVVGSSYHLDGQRMEQRWGVALAEARQECTGAPDRQPVRIPISPEGWAVTATCERVRP